MNIFKKIFGKKDKQQSAAEQQPIAEQQSTAEQQPIAEQNSSVVSPCVERKCHMEELFVRENGDVYPCCQVWMREDLKIGHLLDEDLIDKIINYNKSCQCHRYKLIPGKGEDINFNLLNFELSYKCQATCAMCCVGAPDHNGAYDDRYYESLEKLVDKFNPKIMRLQGGEILIQKKSMDWLKHIKEKHPEILLTLITNGNNINVVDDAINLFSSFCVSIVGFQPETYKSIMGMDVERTKEFCKKLAENSEKFTDLYFKYLITPTNIHEVPLFLDWAMKLNTDIIITDAYIEQYIKRDTFDNYWQKILDRTKKEFTKTIKNNIENYNHKIQFEDNTLKLFNLNKKWVDENNFEKVITLQLN